MNLWGAVGYGAGEVTIKPDGGSTLTAKISWEMAAAGLRGSLLVPSAEGGGPSLALVSDALYVRTRSHKTGRFGASESDVTRLRFGLEGSWTASLRRSGSRDAGAASMTSKLELGMRHDGGHAESSFGTEVGGEITLVDPALGLKIDISGRTLLAHEADEVKDRGISALLAFDPDPGSQRGLSFSLRQNWGGRASGGLKALFAPGLPAADRIDGEATSHWAAEAAYGLPVFGGHFIGSPHVGYRFSGATRVYGFGWRLTPTTNSPNLLFGIKATQRKSDGAKADHHAGIEMTAHW